MLACLDLGQNPSHFRLDVVQLPLRGLLDVILLDLLHFFVLEWVRQPQGMRVDLSTATKRPTFGAFLALRSQVGARPRTAQTETRQK